MDSTFRPSIETGCAAIRPRPALRCRRSGGSVPRLAAILLALLFARLPSGLAAKTLRHAPTGFSASAPGGFHLRSSRGIYRISRGDESVTLMRVHSPVSARATASGFAKEAGMKRARQINRGKSVFVSGYVRKQALLVEFKTAGKYIDVAKFNPGRRRGRSARLTPPVTLADVALLRRIANSRRGGIVSPLQVAVPMRVFSAGGASALVPNIPGWRFSGANGAIDGFRLDQGGFALGIPMALGGYVPSGTCITSVWAPGVGATVTGIAAVPGSGGVLGANFESAYYTVTFVTAGRAYEALFLAGSNDLMFYYSYIAVAAGGPGGIGLALLDTWRTWDPSAAVNVRLNQILATILTTPIPGSPIDPEVFDRANEAWSAYLRM